ncbi:MAG: PIN domain-containing protein [Treponema sp.]|nr:PIN domain-containing protein [Treponema sp.]
MVVAELEYGAQHSSDYEKRKTQYKNFIQDFEIVPFTEKDAEVYGKIKEQLILEGNLIGSNDMLIASVALSHNATIVTHNIREFSRVKGLIVEDWTI